MSIVNWSKFVFISVLSLSILGCSTQKPSLRPSGQAIGVPKNADLPFEEYVSNSRETIQQVLKQQRFNHDHSPYVGGYSLADVVDMRAPFQVPQNTKTLCANKEKGAGKGFLLIHGLTDSPYLLKNISESLSAQYPCSLIRAVLLPGHGTVVGDTLAMKYQDWMGITEYGVNSFDKNPNIDQLYVVGFSTGTALAIKQLKKQSSSKKIKGLVLLSTAVKAKSDLAWLTQYVKYFKNWLDVKQERDGARYSSFSVNAGAQFYQLTADIMDKEYTVDVPVLMAVSADDETINSAAAREFFCKYVSNKRKLLLWFNGFSKHSNANCEGVQEIAQEDLEQRFENTRYRYANLAHTGVSVSPADGHYGVKGLYRDCKFYESEDDKLWDACVSDEGVRVFGEKNIQTMAPVIGDTGMWRRGTFNKDYQKLMSSIMCFTDTRCDLSSIAK